MNTISIITICFNNVEELQRTCASVDNQKNLPFEHIIIDGSATPDIKNWLENSLQPVYRKWICEKDNGISDAFNKGLKKAGGEIINLLNSGDTLYNEDALNKVNRAFENNPGISWCHGKLFLHRGGQWVSIGKPFEPGKLYRGMRGVSHPTMYIKKELYDKHGLYDTQLKIAMDYDFLCRIADEKFYFIDDTIVSFDPSGISTKNYLPAMQECYKSYRKYFGFSLKQKLWSWRLTTLHYLLNSRFGRWLYKLKVKMGWENK